MIRSITSRWTVLLAALFLSALVLRLVAALSIWELPEGYLLNADASEYHNNALAIAGLRDEDLPSVFRLSPGAILWGAMLHKMFGPSLWAVVLPQVLLGAFSVILVAACTRKIGGYLAGIAAGVLMTFCEPLLVYETAILPTGPAVFLVSLFLWASTWTASRPGWRRSSWLGLILGVAVVFRPNLVLVGIATVPFIFAWCRAHRPFARILATAVFIFAMLAPVLPIALANQVRGGVFVPVTSSAGINLFIGNHQGSTGRLNSVFGEHSADKAFELFTTMAERHSKRQMDPAEVSSFWVERTLEEIADDPGRFAFLLWKKTLYGLNDFETPDNLDPAFLEEVTPFLAFPFPGFGFLLVLGLLGIISLWRNDTPGARSVHVVVAATWITMLVFFVSGRYRALMLPALAISAGYCVETFRRKISLLRGVDNPAVKKRIAAQLALFGFFAAGLATLTSLPILHPVHEVEFVKLSDSYVAQGDKAKAAALLEELVNRKSGKGNERLRAWASKRARQLASPEETQ